MKYDSNSATVNAFMSFCLNFIIYHFLWYDMEFFHAVFVGIKKFLFFIIILRKFNWHCENTRCMFVTKIFPQPSVFFSKFSKYAEITNYCLTSFAPQKYFDIFSVSCTGKTTLWHLWFMQTFLWESLLFSVLK